MSEIWKDFGQDEHLPFSALLPPNSLRTLLLFYFGRKLQFRSDPWDIKVRGRGILKAAIYLLMAELTFSRAGNIDVVFI